VEKARKHGVRVASHDDDSRERVEAMHEMGVGISEFPINLETATAAHERGISTIFGAPNVLRGKSQSGSMRALDGVRAGVADCLCADYAPATLIVALFRLIEQTGLELHQAARLVSLNPARAAGLLDRGEIAVGKRADLIAVSHLGGLRQVSQVWVKGNSVLKANFDRG
jgi:alpha-D-ribose 1-methylphosphonate 5-triphosphate diphosphatase